MDKERLIVALAEMCNVSYDMKSQANAKILTFLQGKARVTIRIVFEDEQSGADLLITNMTTLPDSQRNLGNGSICLSRLIHCAKRHGFEDIQATQVQNEAEGFWYNNGFEKVRCVPNDFKYVN